MKWFTASNQASLQNDRFFELLQVAILSAKENTNLEPCFLYEGDECDQLNWIKEQEVLVIKKSLSFYEELVNFWNHYEPQLPSKWLNVRSGAFLRVELPITLKENNITDEYILYTDSDVFFVKNPALNTKKPKFFAAVGLYQGGFTKFRIGGTLHFNSGVMLMNIDNMIKETENFKQFLFNNGYGVKRPRLPFMQKELFLSDQVALNLYYNNKIEKIDSTYNWHPTMGINPQAKIIHFYGLKWNEWDDFNKGKMSPKLIAKYKKLVSRNLTSYKYYVDLVQEFAKEKNMYLSGTRE